MTILEELRSKVSRDNRELLDRAADRIEELEKQMPPCKVGDVVYRADDSIYESTVRGVIFDTENYTFDASAIGKSVFLSREEAERVLKERSRVMDNIFSLLLNFIIDYHIKVEIERSDFLDGFVVIFNRDRFCSRKHMPSWAIERHPENLKLMFKSMISEILNKEHEAMETASEIENSGIVIHLKGADNDQREAD